MADLKLLSMRDIQSERVQFLWEPYIPRGKISIVQGDPGDGKTTLMLAVAAAVTTGAALPGNGGMTVPAGVIFQTAEDGLADTIKPRLEQLGADCARVHLIDENEAVLSLADERIEQAIVKMDAKLFILDPLQAYLGGADMHSVGGVRPLMKSLGAVAERTGCAIVIIGHLNKKGGRAQYRGLGSIDIYAAARSVLTVGKIDVDESMRAMVHGKSNLAPPGAPLAFGLDTGGFTWLGEYEITLEELLSGRGRQVRPESQFARARLLLETELAAHPVAAADVMQRAEERNISAKTLNRAKAALGVVSTKRGGRWFWELPVVVEYTECADNQDSQGGQDGHAPPVTTLVALRGEAHKSGDGQSIFPADEAGEERQDGYAPNVTTLTILPQKGVG